MRALNMNLLLFFPGGFLQNLPPQLLCVALGCVALGCVTDGELPPETNDEAMARTEIRALLLPSPYGDDTVITSEARWYAQSYQTDDFALYVQGTDNFIDAPDDMPVMEPNVRVRGYDGIEGMAESIRTVMWIEDGVAYSVDVECVSVIDQRCARADFLVELAERLVSGGVR